MSDIPFDSGGNNGPVFQSSLGTLNSTHTQQDRNWNHGYLAFGKVLNVYPKRYTADVEIFQTSDKLHSTHEQEGRHGCKIGVSTAGFSDLYQAPYGEIVPIQRGNIVLVGFLKNTKEQPVILRVFHDTTEEVGSFNFRNILSNYFSAYSNIGDILDYLKITPIQDFLKIDRFGNVELSSHTKSFFVATESNLIDDKFDYEDLSPKFPKDKTVVNPLAGISDLYDLNSTGQSYYNWGDDAERQLSVETVHVDEKYSKPKKYMAVFRDNYIDSATNWLRVIIDAARTSFRILKIQQQDNQNTMFDITEDGTIKVRRQIDTRLLFDPQTPQTKLNPTQNPCKIYSEMQMLSDGTIKIETVDRTSADPNLKTGFSSKGNVGADDSQDFPHTLITISPKGGKITIETNNKIAAYAKGGIDMNSKGNINITSEKLVNISSLSGVNITSEKDINVNSETTTRISATENVNMFAPDMYLTGAMDMKGSLDMLGAVDVIGNANFTGKHRINFRGAILDGDIDTWGDFNLEFFCNYIVDMVDSFVTKKLCAKMGINLGDAAAVMGLLNEATNGFSLEDISFNGIASTLEDVAFGVLIDAASPFYNELLEFCDLNGVLPNSISAQIDFLDDMLKQSGIDLNNLGDKTLGSLGGIVDALNTLQSVFGHQNNLMSDITLVLGISTEFELSDLQLPLLQLACGELDIHLKPDNLTTNIINIAAGGVDPRALLGHGVNTVSRSLLGNTIDPTSIIHEGDIIEQKGNGGGKENENDDGDGQQHQQQPADENDNNNGGDKDKTTYKVATIEDALASLERYFRDDLIDQVKAIEHTLDAQLGSDTSQYASTNHAKKSSKTEQHSSGEVITTSRPAEIDSMDQYLDRTVKRYVFTNCERMVKQINAAWKYYTYGM